jgi:c(7)-type cytochrome triheme protein
MNYKNKIIVCILALWLLQFILLAPVMGAAPGDLVFDREDQSEVAVFPPSIFPHWLHRINYRCDACHDSLFKMEKGSTPITMEMIDKGEACGACHNGTIAFGADYVYCDRCHTIPID